MNHSQINPMLTGLGKMFIILAQTPTFAQPSEGAFNNPTLGQDHKPLLLRGAVNNFDANAKVLLTPMNQSRAIVPPIQQQQFPTVKQGNPAQNERQTDFVLPVGRMYGHPDQPSLRINDDVTFTAFDVLATVIAACAPFSVVFTLWLSAISTLASISRPASWRTRSRSSSLIRCHVPLRFNFWNTSYTVDHDGKSWGNIRHEHPVRNTYKIALMYSRIRSGLVCLSRSNWTNCSHCLSLKSLGYAFLLFIPLFYSVILSVTNTFLIFISFRKRCRQRHIASLL